MGAWEIVLIICCVAIVGGVNAASRIRKKQGKCSGDCGGDCSLCCHCQNANKDLKDIKK